MGCSAGVPRFEPPMKNARGFLAIFVLTTNRRTSGAITIRGTSEFSQSTIQKLNATVPFGARWNPSFVRNCLQFEGASRLDYLHAKKTRLCRQTGVNHRRHLAVERPLTLSRERHCARESQRVSRTSAAGLSNPERIRTSSHGCVWGFSKHGQRASATIRELTVGRSQGQERCWHSSPLWQAGRSPKSPPTANRAHRQMARRLDRNV